MAIQNHLLHLFGFSRVVLSGCLMYADDIVLISSSAEGLEVAINKLQLYLSEWHLELNTSKSKIIIFNKSGRKLKQYKSFLITETWN